MCKVCRIVPLEIEDGDEDTCSTCRQQKAFVREVLSRPCPSEVGEPCSAIPVGRTLDGGWVQLRRTNS